MSLLLISGETVFILLYVDDMLLVGKSMSIIDDIKAKLNTTFDMKDSGNARKILGMFIERSRQTVC